MNLLSISLLVAASALAAIGQLLFRFGARDARDLFALLNPVIASGLAVYALGTVLWIFVLSRERLVDVYAFTALTFALVYFGAVLLLGEQMGMRGLLGLALVLLGLYLISS